MNHSYSPILPSPFRLFILITCAIILTETAVMLLFLALPGMPEYWTAIFDTVITTLLIFPALYALTYKPMINYQHRQEQAESELRRAYEELEKHVQDRTADLTQANQFLQAEVAERQRVEQLLTLQSAALQAAANGILITDRSGTIQWSNLAMTRISGYSSQELLGQATRLFKSGEHPPEYYQVMWHTILAGQVWQGETINRRKDGSFYTEEQTITPVKGAEGEITHFIAIKLDVSERKKAEEALSLERERLEETNRALHATSQAERAQRHLAEGLLNAAAAVESSLDLDEVLERILEQTQHVIPCQAAAVLLLENSLLRVVRHRGLGEIPELVPILNSLLPMDAFWPIREVIRLQAPVLMVDSYERPGRENVPGLEWVRAYAIAPLISKQQVTGAIVLLSNQPGQFQEGAADSLQAFATHAMLAISHARLFEAEKRAHQVAVTLQQASLALAQSLKLEHVLQTLLEYLERLVPYDSASILLLEDEKLFTIRAVRGFERWTDPQSQLGLTFDADTNTALLNLTRSQQATLIEDTQEFPVWRSRPGAEHIRNWLGVPLVAGEKVIGLCSLHKAQPGFFTREHLELAEALTRQASVVVQNAWLFEQVQAGRKRLVSLSHRLVEVQENERRYIARELHDEASQALTSLKVGLRLLERQRDDPQAIQTGVAELKGLVEGVMENLHRLAIDLRPASLDHLGLIPALRQHIEAVSEQHGLAVQFEVIGVEERLPPQVETNLYRILQEALTNVVRHAGATRADVLLERRGEKIVAIVEDNGSGFDAQAALAGGGLGISGMRERAEMLGGQFTIESASSAGTTIYVEVPYEHTDPDRG